MIQGSVRDVTSDFRLYDTVCKIKFKICGGGPTLLKNHFDPVTCRSSILLIFSLCKFNICILQLEVISTLLFTFA